MIPALNRKKQAFNAFLIFIAVSSFLFLLGRIDYRRLRHYQPKANFRNKGFPSLNSLNETDYSVLKSKGLKEISSYYKISETNLVTNNSKLVGSKNRHNNVDVLILGQGRSGTSFLGELFNQHPRIAYIFEPLHALSTILQNNIFYEKEIQDYREKTTSTIESFLTCNFTGNEKYLRKFINSHFCYCSRFLKSKPAKTKMQANFSAVKKFYEKELCSFQHRVIKILTGRLSNVSLLSLEEIVQNSKKRNREVKIVHIVRDPRAVVNSWVNLKWIKDYPDALFHRNVKRICEPLHKNLQVRKQRPDWMRKNYKFIRYEELALAPKKLAKEIYDFLGIQLHEDVFRWIDYSKEPSKYDLKNAYSTKRNASIVINRWKKNLSQVKRNEIDEACSSALDQLKF